MMKSIVISRPVGSFVALITLIDKMTQTEFPGELPEVEEGLGLRSFEHIVNTTEDKPVK